MKKLRTLAFTTILALVLTVPVIALQVSASEYEKTAMADHKVFGGTGIDEATSIQQTADGGFIVAGRTESFGAGCSDFWLVKTDEHGDQQWARTFGGTGWDEAYAVQQTTDGGFIVAGSTMSFGAGKADFWLIKTDPDGNKQWERTFGGASTDKAHSVQQTADGGFIVAGKTKSFGAGWYDFWLIKTDEHGDQQWARTFGDVGTDKAYSVQQTTDGGFIVAGSTIMSFETGLFDFWLVKTDAYGNKQWAHTFGDRATDMARSVQQTADGGFVIAGKTTSFGSVLFDFWLVKTDPDGNKQWARTFGGNGRDKAYSVQQTTDGGFVIAGRTLTFGLERAEFMLVKTDQYGNQQWERTFGGTGMDRARSVQQTVDNGFIVAGSTISFGAEKTDFMLVKFDDKYTVVFPDAQLETVVRETLLKPTGKITTKDMAKLTSLKANNRGIVDLSGLEYAVNLNELGLWDNQISDLSALSGLTNLTGLGLSNNQISDISELGGLTGLTWLMLWDNQISDINALSGLTNLTELRLSKNQISDISVLSGLTNLTDLVLVNNQIGDISPLGGLTSLTKLMLVNNQISNISPLSGLTNLTELGLSNNQISNISALRGLTNLTDLRLSKNQISNLSPLGGLTNLTGLGLSSNQISDISALSGLTNLTELMLVNNQISDIGPLGNLVNLDNLGLRDNPLFQELDHTVI